MSEIAFRNPLASARGEDARFLSMLKPKKAELSWPKNADAFFGNRRLLERRAHAAHVRNVDVSEHAQRLFVSDALVGGS